MHVDWRSTAVWAIVLPAVAAVLALAVKPAAAWAQTVLALLLIVPMGPMLYRLAFRRLAQPPC
jgi:branched-chain amino acid transport system permease protein